MKIDINGIVREMTQEEEEQFFLACQPSVEQQIEQLKENLKNTDYQAIKYAEGMLSEEEFAPIKAQRQEWREQINSLQEQ